MKLCPRCGKIEFKITTCGFCGFWRQAKRKPKTITLYLSLPKDYSVKKYPNGWNVLIHHKASVARIPKFIAVKVEVPLGRTQADKEVE